MVNNKPMTLPEFIEQVGHFELKPYQRKLVAAIERGEKLMLDPVTMREPFWEWSLRYQEYLTQNVELCGARRASEPTPG